MDSHPLLSKLFNGMANLKPLEYKSPQKWDIDAVLIMLSSLDSKNALNISHLSWKLAFLPAVASGSRCSELASIDREKILTNPTGVRFLLTKHKKNRKAKIYPGKLDIPIFEDNKHLCPVKCLKVYLDRTNPLVESKGPLFIFIQTPLKGISSSTIARWITNCIKFSGFKGTEGSIAHSTSG